jgi:hypothetical protein
MAKHTRPVTDHLILPALVRLPEGEVHARERANQAVPMPVPLRLLIDTGSKRTTLIPGILRHLNPPAGAEVRRVTPLAVGTVTLFWVRFEFPATGLAPLEHVQVARVALPPELSQFHGLLGRDLLRRLESFDYEGRRGCFTLRDTPGRFGWLRR